MTGGAHFSIMERLERELGDPADPANPLSFSALLAADERADFPVAACRRLEELDVHRTYVPAELGGDLTGAEDLLQVIRVLSRRDLTVTIAHCKTYLGAVSVWLAGTPAQAKELARRVLDGAVVSFALTERRHGSDLLAGELTAASADGGWLRLDGEKWLINNATRADLLCVLSRTDPSGGPRGFSLVLVDKSGLPERAYQCLPKAVLHGVRGADISGIAFDGAMVAADAVVGRPGTGLEIALKSFQITRTLCAGMSLGCADRALRIATSFALKHELYDRRLADLPHAARTLAEAYADTLVVEALALLATRSIQALPGELSVTSAVVKYLAPTRTDRTIASLAQVLGARALLTGATGVGGEGFQKVDRDHRIVGIFDGNTMVNLNSLVNQLPQLSRSYRAGTVDAAGLAGAATLTAALPPIDGDRLALVSRAGSSVVQGLPALVEAITAVAARADVPAGLAAQAGRLRDAADTLHAELAGFRPAARDVPPEDFQLARRYANCFAAAACLHLWWHNRDTVGGGLWADALWVRAALARLLPGPSDEDGPVAGVEQDGEPLDALLPHLFAAHRDKMLFSLFPCRLGGGRTEVSP